MSAARVVEDLVAGEVPARAVQDAAVAEVERVVVGIGDGEGDGPAEVGDGERDPRGEAVDRPPQRAVDVRVRGRRVGEAAAAVDEVERASSSQLGASKSTLPSGCSTR